MSHLAVQAPRTTGREAVLAFLEIDRRLRRLERVDAAASGRLRLALASLRQRFERGLIDPIAAEREADLLLQRSELTPGPPALTERPTKSRIAVDTSA